MSTAARLQAAGLSTVVLEAHGQPGGCAGYFTRRGFSFDVGATTLVDFGPGGTGGDLLERIGLPPVDGEALPGYKAWLSDREVDLRRDPLAWSDERLRKLGGSPHHRRFWALMDRLANVFWMASRRGIRLPIRGLSDLLRAATLVGPAGWLLGHHAFRTLGDALRTFKLRGDAPLCGLLSMLVEDTVHASIDDAPLVNAALGITIRGAGLSRARGGMRGFWRLVSRGEGPRDRRPEGRGGGLDPLGAEVIRYPVPGPSSGPVATSKTFANLSAAALASSEPSGEKAAS